MSDNVCFNTIRDNIELTSDFHVNFLADADFTIEFDADVIVSLTLNENLPTTDYE